MKTNSQDRVSELEKQIIALQRELDDARRQSTSMWCKIYDLCIGLELSEEVSQMMTDQISYIVKEWVRDQRAKVGRRYASLGSLPPYTDCLNDVVVSISDPEAELELAPYSYELAEQGEEGFNAMGTYDGLSTDSDMVEFAQPAGSRIPPPPPSSFVGAQGGTMLGPPKMMKVNVPRAHSLPTPPPKPDSDGTDS
jgi:hypothetical protein